MLISSNYNLGYQNSFQQQSTRANSLPFKKNIQDSVSFSGVASLKEAQENKIIDTIIAKLNDPAIKTVAILTHAKPDGDTIGSAAAMKHIVENLPNKKVEVYVASSMPEGFKILEDTKDFKFIQGKSSDDNPNIVTKLELKDKQYDLAIAVDCAESKMFSKAGAIFHNAKNTMRIDHHPSKKYFADINLVDENATAASQVVLRIAEKMEVPLDKNLASDVYLALVTDSMGFRFLKNPVKGFADALKLAKTGIDTGELYRSALDLMSKPQFELYREALNKIKFANDGKVAYFVETQEARESYPKEDLMGTKMMLTGVANTMANSLKGVKVFFKLSETGGGTGMSIRGKDGTVVNELPNKIGGEGGGHEYAAGGFVQADIEETTKRLLDVIAV